jgi:hypothetical protein
MSDASLGRQPVVEGDGVEIARQSTGLHPDPNLCDRLMVVDRVAASSARLFDNQKAKPKAALYVDSHELAEILSVSVHTIRKWRAQGRIVPKKFGRSVRYAVDEVVAALTRKGENRHA